MQFADAQEAGMEFLDCARYDELDEVKELLTTHNVPVNFADPQGTTALHRASANGHLAIVKYLVENNAKWALNSSGNSPLHWAVQSNHTEVVQYLCEHLDGVDVLKQNGLGKSSLTYGFDVNNSDIMKALLEHPSAEELSEDNQQPPAGDDAAPANQYYEHVLQFKQGPHVRVREMGITPQKLDALQGDLDTTGATMWAASLVLAYWIVDFRSQLEDKVIVELGAGCGLPGLTAYHYATNSRVTITDLKSETFSNTQHNVTINRKTASDGDNDAGDTATPSGSLDVAALDWMDEASWPEPLKHQVDFLVGSDLVYDKVLVAPLLDTVLGLLKPNGTFLYVSADNSRAGKDEFIDALGQAGFTISREEAPEQFTKNALVNGDQAKFDLHFNEIAEQKFFMYRCERNTR